MIVLITRFVFMTAGALGGFLTSRLIDWTEQIGYPQYFAVFIFLVLGVSIGYLLGSIFGREFSTAFGQAEARLHDTSSGEIILGTVGLLVGLVIGWLVGLPLRLIEPSWLAVLSLIALLAMTGHLGVRIALLKSGDLARVMPGLTFGTRDAVPASARPILLDTSAIIDGRFLALRALGVIDGDIRVPRFVLAELHTLADSADDIKRGRGRRGLDFLARKASSGDGAIELFEADYPEIPEVDGKLVRLASEMGAVVVTVDHNLTDVARAEGVAVINLNEVATAVKPTHLPGERLRLAIVREGKEASQGVGYLEDGTMVVVADGSGHIGTTIETEVTSVLQTSAGRMAFARFVAISGGGDGDE
ncbi:MAG: hypothetical protein KGZ40_03880 [Clostridiales bacterium]|nr:hypothetical protein [Clostridiales bacterium]